MGCGFLDANASWSQELSGLEYIILWHFVIFPWYHYKFLAGDFVFFLNIWLESKVLMDPAKQYILYGLTSSNPFVQVAYQQGVYLLSKVIIGSIYFSTDLSQTFEFIFHSKPLIIEFNSECKAIKMT